MWTATLDLDLKKVLLTRLLGRFYTGAYVASFSPLQVQNLPRQTLPANNWVRVRNRLAGICGSDLHLVCADGDFRIAPAALPGRKPTYLGHEVVGEVIEIGDDVQHLRVGDRVVLQNGPNCVSAGVQPLCRFCAVGNYNLCENGPLPGPEPIGAGWSEEMLLHEQQLFPISSEISDEQAVMIEPTAVALHSILRHPPQSNDRVLIIGAGTIGLLTLQVVQLLAPDAEISILARHAFQVEQATRMGATHIIYPQDAYTGVQHATHARLYHGMFGNSMFMGGYDVIYDTVGSQRTLHNALRWVRAQGTVVHSGISLHFIDLDLSPIWYQEVNLLGATSHGIENWPLDSNSNTQRSTFSIVTEMLELGRIHPEKLITHHFALNDYKQAITTTISKSRSRAIKVVFDHSLLPVSVVPNVRTSARLPRPAIIGPNARRKARDGEAVELPVTPPPANPVLPAGPEPEEEPVPTTTAANTTAHIEDDWDQDTETAIPIVKFPQAMQPVTPAPEKLQSNIVDDHDPASVQPIPDTPTTLEHASQPLSSSETHKGEAAQPSVTPAEPDLDPYYISEQPTGEIPVVQPASEHVETAPGTHNFDERSADDPAAFHAVPYEATELAAPSLDPYLSEQPTEGIPLADLKPSSAPNAPATETDEQAAETPFAQEATTPAGETVPESSENAQTFISFAMETDKADTEIFPPIQYFPDPAESIDIIQSALEPDRQAEESAIPGEPPLEPATEDQAPAAQPVEAAPSDTELTETTVTKEADATLNPIEEEPVAQKRPRAPRKRRKNTESLQ